MYAVADLLSPSSIPFIFLFPCNPSQRGRGGGEGGGQNTSSIPFNKPNCVKYLDVKKRNSYSSRRERKKGHLIFPALSRTQRRRE